MSVHEGQGVRVSGTIVRGLVSYLRRSIGVAGMQEVLDEAGLDTDPDDESHSWFSARDLADLVKIAEARLGEPELGRRAGEEMFRVRPDVHPFFHSAGSVRAAVKTAVTIGSRTRTEPAFRVLEEADDHLVVHATSPKSTRFACGVSAGYWAQVPSLFDTIGTVIEPSCVTRGDPHCEFRVAWQPVKDASSNGVARSRSRGNTLVSRFEELLTLAAELTAEDSRDGLLHKIADRAVAAVLTPGVIVAVRFSPNDHLAVGWSGISEERAQEIANAVDMGLIESNETVGVVAIESPRQHYGSLIAVGTEGSPFSSNEMRMLAAYAGHATAAIEAAAALEEARTERDAAESLLGLARVLSGVGTPEEISQRIAEAVPTVVKCDLAAMLAWDPDKRTLTFTGSWPHPVDALGFDMVEIDDVPLAKTVVEEMTAVRVATADTDGLLRSLLRAAGATTVVAAPVAIRGDVVALILAASSEEWSESVAAPVVHRLSGLADHAATALDNNSLLQHIQHQALHDSLTGLPNRTLVADRVEHALAVAERADRWITLLFVDLDRFKEINDELGHAAGDTVLKELAARLDGCVRASDTVARLGGDEFLVLLENTCGDEDGARVAEKIIESLRVPFEVAGSCATVSVSIGITSAPGRGTSYDELLARADEAMYEVKHHGRNGWQIYASSV